MNQSKTTWSDESPITGHKDRLSGSNAVKVQERQGETHISHAKLTTLRVHFIRLPVCYFPSDSAISFFRGDINQTRLTCFACKGRAVLSGGR